MQGILLQFIRLNRIKYITLQRRSTWRSTAVTSDVENCPGYPDGVMGPEMMVDLRYYGKFVLRLIWYDYIC